MPTDPQGRDRVLDALTESTKAQTLAARRIDSLEHKFETLESTLNTRMEHLELQMGSMNAHLDNLVRGVETTNRLLQDANDAAKAEADRKLKLEEDERKHRMELEKDQRETYKKIGTELWVMFKQPLGFLVAAIVAWILYAYFGVPTLKPELQAPELQAPEQPAPGVQAPGSP